MFRTCKSHKQRSRVEKKRPFVSQPKLGFEILEGRRMMAIGLFERLDSIVFSTGGANAAAGDEDDFKNQASNMDFWHETVSRTAGAAAAAVSDANAAGVGQALASVNVPPGGFTAVPTVNVVAAAIASAVATDIDAGANGGGGGRAALNAQFRFHDPDEGATPQWFHGYIFTGAVGAGAVGDARRQIVAGITNSTFGGVAMDANGGEVWDFPDGDIARSCG